MVLVWLGSARDFYVAWPKLVPLCCCVQSFSLKLTGKLFVCKYCQHEQDSMQGIHLLPGDNDSTLPCPGLALQPIQCLSDLKLVLVHPRRLPAATQSGMHQIRCMQRVLIIDTCHRLPRCSHRWYRNAQEDCTSSKLVQSLPHCLHCLGKKKLCACKLL